jgi:cobaltochelatase CobN
MLQEDLAAAWGDAELDSHVHNGQFHFPAFWHENALIALQPERGAPELRDEEYHDLARTPRHSYVAFYLWLREQGMDAVIHMGAHGTLEWLPGKAVALSDACWPEALTQGLPVIYPFIVNDPGEAAQAKRRIGAVTLGHVPPLLRQSGTPEKFVPLETLLDEFSNADGLDPKRRDRLKGQIRDMAVSLGVEADLGITDDMSEGEALTRIDRFVCDVKEAQYGDGLHVYGRVQDGALDPNSAECEKNGLIRALQGKRISSGPSGSPYRGRNDVLPTGRNLYTTDPLSVPTRASFAQGVILADEFVRRHLQDNGDWPRGVIVDLWGSATMRTAGEEFAMAMALLGVKPVWNEGSERVSGIEVIPITEMDRPRIDVTLRVSGLFRDVFPTLSTLFNQAIRVLSERDEASDWNPYAGQTETVRVYGPAPGAYGLDMGHALEDYSEQGRADAAQSWLRNSSWAIDGERISQDRKGIETRVEQSDSFIHLQDLAETDVLMAADYAAHEAGFAAAKTVTGGQAALYHIDTTNPAAPKARTLKEEIAKTVLARASNPNWIAGMQRHGFRGAAEIAATLDHMGSFAHLAGLVEGHLFDAYYMATLGDDDVAAFLRDANPRAYQSMLDRFNALAEAGLWISRRNSITHDLETLRQEAQA